MQDIESSKVKIFVIYYKSGPIFKSNIYQPILTAPVDWDSEDIIYDNSKINIADKNKNYAELSAHYWVLKNFLPQTNSEYVGFCHYRRFLDFNLNKMPNVPFKPILTEDFQNIFKTYTEENVLNSIKNYDVIVPQKFRFEKDILLQYLEYHPKEDFVLMLNVLKELYPEYFLTAAQFISSKEMYPCLQFIMKKELLNEYLEWIFNILTALEQKSNWKEYNTYNTIRMPAFLAERLFNIWLLHNMQKRKLNVLATTSFILTGENQGTVSYKDYITKYNIAANSALYKS